MILDADEVGRCYRRIAPYYDVAVSAYRLVGIERQRSRICRALRLRPGDTVVDLGCGTGANLSYLHRHVGASGRIVAVDLSDAMLDQARRKITRAGFGNVELVEADIRHFELPPEISGVVASFALEMIPDYDAIVQRIAAGLPCGGRLALLGLQEPRQWPGWLVDLAIALNRPFGVNRSYSRIKPWQAVARHMAVVDRRDLMFGGAYRCVGEKRRPGPGS